MLYDFTIPSAFLVFSALSVYLYPRLEGRINSLMGGKSKIGVKEALVLVSIIALNLIVLMLIPEKFLVFLVLMSLSLLFYLTGYILTQKKIISLITVAVFLSTYFLYWNVYTFDLTAAYLVVGASLVINNLLNWEAALAFVSALTVVDVVHVFFTKVMIGAAQKALKLQLPLMLVLPSLPTGNWILIGLGDFLVASVICVQTQRKFKFRNAGYMISFFMAFSGVIMGLVALNTKVALPATIFLVAGWIIALTIIYITKTHFKTP